MEGWVEKGEGDRRKGHAKKESIQVLLATFKSPFAHAVPWSCLLLYFCLFACLPSVLLSAGEVS